MASTTRAAMMLSRQLQTSSRRLGYSSASPATLIRTSSSMLSRTPFAQRSAIAARTAPFTTSSQRGIMPPGPQVIEGGVNDPQPVPEPHSTHGKYHWTAERAISVALVPLTLAPFAAGSLNPTLDAIFAATLIIHSHIGFQSCVTDYFSTKKHPGLRKFFDWTLNIATILVAIGIYEFETNDVGIVEGTKRIWHAGAANDSTIGKASLEGMGHDGKLKHLTN